MPKHLFTVVYPAAMLPEMAAKQGAKVIHINPQNVSTAFANEIYLMGKAGEILPLLLG